MFYLQVIFLLITGCLYGCGPQLSSAIKQNKNSDVLKAMCTNSVDMCPCDAKNLVVTVKGKQNAIPCGSSVKVESLAFDLEHDGLNIKPPVGVKLRKVFQFVI